MRDARGSYSERNRKFDMVFGRVVSQLRTECGMTQQELAEQLRWGIAKVAAMEGGEDIFITLNTAYYIARSLRCDPDDFLRQLWREYLEVIDELPSTRELLGYEQARRFIQVPWQRRNSDLRQLVVRMD